MYSRYLKKILTLSGAILSGLRVPPEQIQDNITLPFIPYSSLGDILRIKLSDVYSIYKLESLWILMYDIKIFIFTAEVKSTFLRPVMSVTWEFSTKWVYPVYSLPLNYHSAVVWSCQTETSILQSMCLFGFCHQLINFKVAVLCRLLCYHVQPPIIWIYRQPWLRFFRKS